MKEGVRESGGGEEGRRRRKKKKRKKNKNNNKTRDTCLNVPLDRVRLKGRPSRTALG